ncbi:MAG: class I SAM-dependent methyltransferase [Planctomycetota bacterium]|nr:class I SAM-dependent methyltransferase [Planctomycetota bacterium]MDA1262437.1 class I SAM-dependent methyltransferase [Planctomycetota bacterium]
MVQSSQRDEGRSIDIGRVAREMYVGGSFFSRFVQHNRHRIAPVATLVDVVPYGSDVLDIGCGGGLLLICLASAGRIQSAHGIDSSLGAIESARKAALRSKNLINETKPIFECRSVEQGLPEGKFSVVCLIDVLHHVTPIAQEKAFRDAAAKVRLGGMLLYKDMCDQPLWRAGLNRLHDLVIAKQWIHYVPIEDVDRWALDCGLQIERAQEISMLWYGHELRVFRKSGADS